ncbi:hypothetical protein [Actinocorallia libanotica]|uniref:DUF222 domain-containing protein n=1 Tax=Actinocorallia libanotica TaxID=46162 RepID=A0ABN1RZK2_9ACTN
MTDSHIPEPLRDCLAEEIPEAVRQVFSAAKALSAAGQLQKIEEALRYVTLANHLADLALAAHDQAEMATYTREAAQYAAQAARVTVKAAADPEGSAPWTTFATVQLTLLAKRSAALTRRAMIVRDTLTTAQMMDEAALVANAAGAALNATAMVLREMARLSPPAQETTADRPRRPGRTAAGLTRLAAAVLPAGYRARYAEEWLGLLWELPTRRQRARHLLSVLAGAPRQAYVLRRPLRKTA